MDALNEHKQIDGPEQAGVLSGVVLGNNRYRIKKVSPPMTIEGLREIVVNVMLNWPMHLFKNNMSNLGILVYIWENGIRILNLILHHQEQMFLL